jgi:hypothetical protein
MRTFNFGLTVIALVCLSSPRIDAADFVVRFENHTNQPIRIKTIKFGNRGTIALNNGMGFDLAPGGKNGNVQEATFSGGDSRVIVVWNLKSGKFMGVRQEVINQRCFVGVTPVFGDSSRVDISIGALP